jgi:peptide/nickel transport system ATP-binding protein
LKPKAVHAINHISFEIAAGKVMALVGESGSGKSTVARVLGHLTPYDSGTIYLQGQVISRLLAGESLRQYLTKVQMIFQDPFGSLNPHYTLRYPLDRALTNLAPNLNRKERLERISTVLEQVGLTPVQKFFNAYPHELSGGQRQRAIIARALIVHPTLVLADEPTSMLDVSIRMGILNLLKRLQADYQMAYLFITHDLASARYVADDILVMYAGRIVESGPIADVIDEPLHPYSQLLLSAVPDPTRDVPIQSIAQQGEPPDLSRLPKGCAFYPRCPLATEVCREVLPPLINVDHQRMVACHAVHDQVKEVVTGDPVHR